MTNFSKLARWDADWYKAQSDDDCIVCLTEKQAYLISQVIEQIKWSRTRWTGDISGLDFDAIASELNHRISERMTCETISNISVIINNLTEKIIDIEGTVNTIYNNTNNENDIDVFIFDPNTSKVTDNNTPQQLQDLGVSTPTCTNAEKDKIYGACVALVNYINQRNVDFLEQINQAGNVPDQIARAISAIPGLGALPVDEVFDWVRFIASELEDEYNATVTQALLQDTICDLFCIAVASGCKLDFNDVYNYFGSKVDPTVGLGLSTFLNLVQFGLTGTFSGNMYFHYMCFFQLAVVGVGQFFLGIDSLQDYAYQTRAGLNSPDNDWTIFCLDCPPVLYRILEWDFTTLGEGDWYLDEATVPQAGEFVDGVGWQGTPSPANPKVVIAREVETSWLVRAVAFNNNWTFNVDGGARSFTFRPTKGSAVGQSAVNLTTGTGNYNTCKDGIASTNFEEIAIAAQINDDDGHVIIERVALIFDADKAPVGAVITEDNTLCS